MSRCRDGMCGATDCSRCYPPDPVCADDIADELYENARQKEIDSMTDAEWEERIKGNK